jgi:anti-sigma B factor antagonist
VTTEFDKEPLTLASRRDGDDLVIALAGELDPHTAPQLEQAIAEGLAGPAPTRLVLDVSELGFMDSSGLRVIIKAHQELEAVGASLVLRSPTDTVLRLLEITDLRNHLTVETA